MARYLFEGRYNSEGIKGVLKEGGSGRKAAVEAAVKSMGGHIEAYYFAFGETDVYVIVDGLDNVSAGALAMGISASGAVGVKTTVLLTVEEIDQAAKKTLAYRAPGH
jgi:uncharacterized protein with GYD domain